MNHIKHDRPPTKLAWRSKLVLVGFLAVAGFYLWTEHREHVLGALPYLLLLACPLMHLFHHGHGHHHGTSNRAANQNGRVASREEERHEP